MFYLRMPDLIVSILDVEDAALHRLKHFATCGKLFDDPNYVKYLTASTVLDCAGYFCLRTHASLTDDCSLKEMIIEGECCLISERLSLLKPNCLRKNLSTIIDDIGHMSVTDDIIDVVLKVCSEYKIKQHVSCHDDCNQYSIQVPWQKCLTLLSNHKVHLIEGIAIVPCNQWKNVLVDLFRLIYIKSLSHFSRSTSALPEKNLQIEYLNDKINQYYYSKITILRKFSEQISLDELESKKILLPPCMFLSLNSLLTNHRLAHDPRYRLTLFLKDIGVPLEQTLMLFKQEYSKSENPQGTCTCNHTWDEHNKRIEYNVRHTYGVVGSKKNYQMTSCLLIQKQNLQISDEGCCPFVHYNEDKLKTILEEFISLNDAELNDLNDLRNSDQPISACHWFANKLFQIPQPLYHTTPTQYFFNSKTSNIIGIKPCV